MKYEPYTNASDTDRMITGRVIAGDIERYFKRYGIEEDFKIWLRERNKKDF